MTTFFTTAKAENIVCSFSTAEFILKNTIGVKDSLSKKPLKIPKLIPHKSKVLSFSGSSIVATVNYVPLFVSPLYDGYSYVTGGMFKSKCTFLNIPLLVEASPQFVDGIYNRNLSTYGITFDYEKYLKDLKGRALRNVDSIKNGLIKKQFPEYFQAEDSIKKLEKLKHENVSEPSSKDLSSLYQKRDLLRLVLLQDLKKNDSSTSANKTSHLINKIDSIINVIERLEKRCSNLEDLDQKYLKANTALHDTLQKLDNLKLKINETNSVEELEKLGSGKLGKTKFLPDQKLSKIEGFNIGNFTIQESVLLGGPITGSGLFIKYHPNLFTFQVAGGIKKNLFAPIGTTDLSLTMPTGQQMLLYLKAGAENDNSEKHVGLLFLKDYGQSGLTLPVRRTNYVLTFGNKLKLGNKTLLAFDIAKSQLIIQNVTPESTSSPTTNSFLNKIAMSGSLSHSVTRINTDIKLSVDYTGNEFIVISQPYYADRGMANFSLSHTTRFFKNRIQFTQTLTKGFTPVLSNGLAPLQDFKYINMLSINISKNLRLSGSYSDLVSRMSGNSSSLYPVPSIKQKLGMLNAQYTMPGNSLTQIVSVSYLPQFIQAKEDTGSINSSNQIAMINDLIKWKKQQVNLSIQYNSLVSTLNQKQTYGGGIKYGYTFSKIKTTCSLGTDVFFDRVTGLSMIGASAGINATLWKKIIIGTTQKVYNWVGTPGGGNQLFYQANLSLGIKFN